MVELNHEQKQEVKKEINKQVAEAKKEIEKEERRIHKQLLERATKTASLFGQEFRQQTAAAIIAAFGFLIALAWKDLIVKIVEQFTASNILTEYPYFAELFSALIVTGISVIGIVIISRWAKK